MGPASEGTIRLTREPRGRRDRLRSYSILLDSKPVGNLVPAQTIDLPVSEGPHSVQIAIDWARSPAIGVDVASGETVHLRCAPNTAQPGLWGATFGRKKYVRLWRAEASDDTDPAKERLPVPWLRFVMLAVLLAALGFAIAYGRTVDAAAVALLALVPASVIGAWAVARRRRS